MNCYKTDIFKQSIFSFKLDLDLNNINNYCLEYEKNNEGRIISNWNGFQSNDLDFNNPIIYTLSSLILNNINYVSKRYFKLNKCLSISNLWFNINRHKDSNIKHNHPKSLLSGVFYSKTPNNSGNIKFFNSENAETFFSGVNMIEYTKYNSSSYVLKPESSFLHIFPSFLNHCVEPNLSDQERISFSFNTNTI